MDQNHDEALVLFQSITGIEDIGESIARLEGHGWNVDAAVNSVLSEREGPSHSFGGDFGGSSHYASIPPSPPQPPATSRQPPPPPPSVVASATPPPAGGLWGLVSSTFKAVGRFAGSLLGGDAQPEPAHERFLREYESQFGTAHPRFYAGSYKDAALATRSNPSRLLVVYLHSPGHPAAVEFCARTMSDPRVVALLSDSDRFALWAGSIASSPDAWSVQSLLHVSQYPFTAVFCSDHEALRGTGQTVMLSGGGLPPTSLILLDQIAGPVPPEHYAGRLEMLTGTVNAALVSSRAQAVEVDRARELREAQDREYHEALQHDMLKEQEEREAREREERERLEAEERELEQRAIRESRLEDMRRFKLRHTATAEQQQLPSDQKVCTVRVKLPDGASVQRKWLASAKVGEIRDFVHATTWVEEDENTADVSRDVRDSSHIELSTNMPRRVLDAEQTLEEAGLCPQGLVISRKM